MKAIIKKIKEGNIYKGIHYWQCCFILQQKKLCKKHCNFWAKFTRLYQHKYQLFFQAIWLEQSIAFLVLEFDLVYCNLHFNLINITSIGGEMQYT